MRQKLNEGNVRIETELLVFTKAKDLAAYILLISGRSPIKYRYSLLNPLINYISNKRLNFRYQNSYVVLI